MSDKPNVAPHCQRQSDCPTTEQCEIAGHCLKSAVAAPSSSVLEYVGHQDEEIKWLLSERAALSRRVAELEAEVTNREMRIMRKAEHAADWQSRAVVAERRVAELETECAKLDEALIAEIARREKLMRQELAAAQHRVAELEALLELEHGLRKNDERRAEAAEAALAAAQRDAERYRLLRNGHEQFEVSHTELETDDPVWYVETGDSLDAAIDAALNAEKP